jgi:hypothetical protein
MLLLLLLLLWVRCQGMLVLLSVSTSTGLLPGYLLVHDVKHLVGEVLQTLVKDCYFGIDSS